MKISKRGRYAVMAMVDLAQDHLKQNEDALYPVRLADIADRQEISRIFLEQIFVSLRHASLVVSKRGARGGYRLSRPPAQISIGDIVAAVDESVDVTQCQALKGCLSKQTRCLTHDLWAQLGESIAQFLDNISLQDVLTANIDAHPLPMMKPPPQNMRPV